MFSSGFVYYFSSVWVDVWPPFGKELLTRLTICSLLTICNFLSCPCFGFEGGIWVLIIPVLGHCILVTFVSQNGQTSKNGKMKSLTSLRKHTHAIYCNFSRL